LVCDVETRDANTTGIGHAQSKETLDRRSFFCGVRANQRNNFARIHLEIERIEHHATAVTVSEIIGAEHGDQMKRKPARRFRRAAKRG